MSILLTILKIIGIILLCVIGLILAVLLIVLFVPFRYGITARKAPAEPDAKATDGLMAEVRASYLLHLISFKLSFSDGKLSKILKIFGIDTSRMHKDSGDGKKKKKKKKKAPKSAEPRPLSEIAAPKKKVDEEEEPKEEAEQEIKEENKPESAAPLSEEPAAIHEEVREESLLWKIAEKIYQVLRKVFRKIRKTAQKLQKAWQKISRYLDLVTDVEFGEAVAKALRELGMILKALLMPRRIRGNVDYGSGDPAKTGQTLAIVAATIPIHKNRIALTPHFEEKVLYGELDIRGNIYLYKVVFALVRIILNKNIQYVIKFLKNKEEQENG